MRETHDIMLNEKAGCTTVHKTVCIFEEKHRKNTI